MRAYWGSRPAVASIPKLSSSESSESDLEMLTERLAVVVEKAAVLNVQKPMKLDVKFAKYPEQTSACASSSKLEADPKSRKIWKKSDIFDNM